jgi:hypothetical protein
MQSEVICIWKIPIVSSGTEPASFRIDQLRHENPSSWRLDVQCEQTEGQTYIHGEVNSPFFEILQISPKNVSSKLDFPPLNRPNVSHTFFRAWGLSISTLHVILSELAVLQYWIIKCDPVQNLWLLWKLMQYKKKTLYLKNKTPLPISSEICLRFE